MTCDVCAVRITEENRGQVTAEDVICHECLLKAARRGDAEID